MTQKFQLGDIAYFFDDYDNSICYGTIVCIGIGSSSSSSGDNIIITLEKIKDVKQPKKSTNYKYKKWTLNQNVCEKTEAEIRTIIAAKEQAAQDVYRCNINSIEDLIKFVLDNDVSGKSYRAGDERYVATEIQRKRIVFIEKAQELLGLSNLSAESPEDCDI